MEEQKVLKIEISHRTVIFTVFFLFFLWLIYQLRHILVVLFVGIILTSALNPAVERLERFKIPRLLGAIIVYALIILFLGLVLTGVIPPLISQTKVLVSRFPSYYRSLENLGVDSQIIDSQINYFLNRLSSISFDLIRVTFGFLGNFLIVFTLLIVSFYLLLERRNLDEYLKKLFGPADKKVGKIISKVEKRLGEWAKAQITLMLIVGVMCYLGLVLLGIEFALPLALLAGILEIVPNIGPTLSAIPAILAGLAISPLMGLAVAALYFLVQQVENHIIVPQVIKKEVGMNPLITILSLIAGFRLGGVLGAILAVPFLILLETLLRESFSAKNLKEKFSP
jgi:predicted PurR-regulated permease PerM